MNLQKITLNGKRYTTIGMQNFYPFGGIIEAPDDDEECLVRKKLCYQTQEDLKMVRQMAALIRGLNNEFLIEIVEIDASEPNTCNLYYEYVPLTIDKWVLEMGQELIKELHFQLLNLASFLSHKGFKFTFNPHCVGLSKEIKVKYFLNQFAIDKENKLTNYKENEKLINHFFDELTVNQKGGIEEMTRQTISSNGVESSIFVRESWDSRSWKSSGSGKGETEKKITNKISLLERLEHTKKKSLEAIERLKGSKLKFK